MMDENNILPGQPVSGDYGYSSNPVDYNSVSAMPHYPNDSMQQMNPANLHDYDPNAHTHANNYYSSSVDQNYDHMNQNATDYNLLSYNNYQQKDIPASTTTYLAEDPSYNSSNTMEVDTNYAQSHCMSSNYPDVNNVTNIGQSVLDPLPNYFHPDTPTVMSEPSHVPVHSLSVNSPVPIPEEFNVPQINHSEHFQYKNVNEQNDVEMVSEEAKYTEISNSIPVFTSTPAPIMESVHNMYHGTHLKQETLLGEHCVTQERSHGSTEDQFIKQERSPDLNNKEGNSRDRIEGVNEIENWPERKHQPLLTSVKSLKVEPIEKSEQIIEEPKLATVNEQSTTIDSENITVEDHIDPELKTEIDTSFSVSHNIKLEDHGTNDEVTSPVNGSTDEVYNENQEIQRCIRSGCPNIAVENPEWELEFCSNECVVTHCKNVFNAWKKTNEVNSS